MKDIWDDWTGLGKVHLPISVATNKKKNVRWKRTQHAFSDGETVEIMRGWAHGRIVWLCDRTHVSSTGRWPCRHLFGHFGRSKEADLRLV